MPQGMTSVVVVLVALALWLRVVEGTWWTPGPLFAAYWCAWLAATAIWGHDYDIPLAGPWFIVAAVVAVASGSHAVASPLGVVPGGRRVIPRRGALVIMALTGGLAGLAAAVMTLIQSGLSAARVTSTQALFEAGNQISVARYSGSQGPAAVPWLLAVCYAASLSVPFLLVGRGRSSWITKLLVVLPLLGVLTYATISTARLPLLLCFSFTAVTTLLAVSFSAGHLPRARPRQVAMGVVLVLMLAVAFAFIAFVRVGTSDSAVRPVIYDKLKVYGIGSVPAFSQWLELPSLQQTPSRAPSLGQATFGAPARALGLDATLSRAYQGGRQIDSHVTGVTTNIYTAFRSLITDYGRGGALLFLGFLGFLAARLQHLLLSGRALQVAPALAAVYGYLLNTNSQSIFWFTNVWLGLGLAVLVLWWSAVPPRTRQSITRSGIWR